MVLFSGEQAKQEHHLQGVDLLALSIFVIHQIHLAPCMGRPLGLSFAELVLASLGEAGCSSKLLRSQVKEAVATEIGALD